MAAAQEENGQYVSGSEADAEVIKNEFQEAIDQSYSNDVETSNAIRISTVGEPLPGPEPETGTIRVRGSYSYPAPDGTVISVTWVADEFGFRAQSEAIPVNADGVQAGGEAAQIGGAPPEPIATETV